MTAQIIDGKALAEELRQGFKARVEALTAKGHKPGLVVILVGADPASEVYVRNKVNGCLAIGMHSEKITYDATVDQGTVLDKIAELNANPNIHGILVQLPLPKHFDEEKVLEAISAEKDVDGFHADNVDLTGKEAVVIGRSNIVGKPMALLLINAGATVTVCNSRTKDLLGHTRRADILVAAVGKPKFVTADMVKPGAVVIDVGINRLPDGKLCGDSDWPTMQAAAKILKEFGVPFEARVVSAHRTPDLLFDYAAMAGGRGLKAIIAGAGGAAHLPGMLAAKTTVPVLGVPVQSKALSGVDSLHSIVQMPKANENPALNEKLQAFRQAQTEKVLGMTLPEV